MLKLRKILLCNYLYYILFIIVFLNCFIRIQIIPCKSKYSGTETIIEGYVNKLFINGDNLSLEIIGKEKVLVSYYFKNREEKNKSFLKLGDYVSFSGNIKKPSKNSNFNIFNYKKYLNNKKIFYLFNAKKYYLIKKNSNIFFFLKQKIIDRISKFKYSKEYMHAFLLGNNSYIKKDIYKSFQENGVSHLFAISGMHISFITIVLLKLFSKFKLNESKKYIFIFIFLIFFSFLTNFSPSVLRASLFFILLGINKIFYFHIKTINILLITLFILLLYNPSYIFFMGFQFSFIISFFLIAFSKIFSKNYFKSIFQVSVVAFLASMPIVLYNFFEINFLSPFLNVVFVPFVSFLVFPIAILSFFIRPLSYILNILINILEFLTLQFSKIKFLKIVFFKPSFIIIILLYIFIILILIKKNKFIIFSLFIILFLMSNISYFNTRAYLIMLDIGQGDSFLLVLPHNKGNILIDTGGFKKYRKEDWKIKNSEYSIASNILIPVLKSNNIKKIDYLIITHGDMDHIGEAYELVSKYKVLNVVLNIGRENYAERKLICLLKNRGINYSFSNNINILKIGGEEFYFVNNYNYDNENDNSISIFTIINNKRILFTGDISKKVEKNIIKEYDISNLDILKVAHHGSKTSSDSYFIDFVNPKLALISAGKNNKFNHPNKEVIDLLNKKKIKFFLTARDGSVKIFLDKEKLYIKKIN